MSSFLWYNFAKSVGSPRIQPFSVKEQKMVFYLLYFGIFTDYMIFYSLEIS